MEGGGGEKYVTQHELNNVVNNLSNNLVGTANNLQENQMGLQEQILDLQKNNVLLGTFYYRIFNPNTDVRNYLTKSTKQAETDNLRNLDYEAIRQAVDGIEVDSKEINNTFVLTTGSNIHKELYELFYERESSIPYSRIDIETIGFVNNNTGDSVYGKVIYNDGIIPGTQTITGLDELTFTVTGGSGIYSGAKKIVVQFINDTVYDSTNKDIRPRKCDVIGSLAFN